MDNFIANILYVMGMVMLSIEHNILEVEYKFKIVRKPISIYPISVFE